MSDICPQISFCIVSFNTQEVLRDCLNSLLENPVHIPYEIIVIDNHSIDGTADMLRSEFPAVKLVINDVNRGYTAPMNQALRMARAERFFVQLNPDTLILPGSFDCLVDYMGTHPEVGICTPKVLNRDGTLQKQCRRSAARPWDTIAYFLKLYRLNPKSRLFNGYLMGYFDEDETHEVEACSGSCMLIRREVVDQVGYLDEQFFAWQEDADFCFRTRQAGWKIIYVPSARIVHFGGQGGSQIQLTQSIIEWHRSYYLYYRKNLAKDYFFLFNGLYYCAMFLKLCLALFSACLSRRSYVGTPKP